MNDKTRARRFSDLAEALDRNPLRSQDRRTANLVEARLRLRRVLFPAAPAAGRTRRPSAVFYFQGAAG